ncbi:MAG: glycoside hydrolase family 125 protein [Acidobacteria bacterium]|nr:glycoside hydrolase family 125 protein [Acidobacteriota bacterium]
MTDLFERALVELGDRTIFVATGDIPAMWLRDSTWQLRPLLAAANNTGEIEKVIVGVSKRQSEYLLIDPYANAFNPEPNDFHWHKDFPDQNPWVFERKFELDSIAAFWDLALRLYRVTGQKSHLDDNFWRATKSCLELLRREQAHSHDSYIFTRTNAPTHDYLSNGGRGAEFESVGFVWSGFRPSDDACELPFHIPSNLHLTNVLSWLSELSAEFGYEDLANQASEISLQISKAVAEYGIVDGRFVYEVDGMGNFIDIDDPNVPSLLSLPYLNVLGAEDETYLATREFILSKKHKMFVSGEIATGISSIHTPPRNIWPLAIAVEGLTTTSQQEAEVCLQRLEALSAKTLANHESVSVDDADQFTRSWFSWADMTYLHLLLRVHGLSEQAD